jgi:hypothetical protein
MASVIIRHGSNTHNNQGPIAVLTTNLAAKELIESGKVDCYNGQYLEIVGLSTLSAADRNHVQSQLVAITRLDCCGRDLEAWELVELDHGAYRSTGECQECWKRATQ